MRHTRGLLIAPRSVLQSKTAFIPASHVAPPVPRGLLPQWTATIPLHSSFQHRFPADCPRREYPSEV